MGTSEDVIIEILASRTKAQIKEIIKAYKEGKVPGALICVVRPMWDGGMVLPTSTVSMKMGFLKGRRCNLTLLQPGKQNTAMLREFRNPFLGLHAATGKAQQITNLFWLGHTGYCQNVKETVAMHLAFSPH